MEIEFCYSVCNKSIIIFRDEGDFLCRREEEVQVQAVRAAEAVRRVVVAARQGGGVVRLIAVPIDVLTVAVGVHQRFLPEGSGGISPQGFRRM